MQNIYALLRVRKKKHGSVAKAERKRFIAFWEKISKTDVARVTFFEYMPQNAEEFLLWVTREDKDARFVIRADTKDIVALYWLNNPLGKTAMIHFCFCKDTFKEQEAVGKFVVQGLLLAQYKAGERKGEYALDALMGITPKVYRHALSYIKKLGFKLLGEVPNICCFTYKNCYKNGVLSVLTRETMVD